MPDPLSHRDESLSVAFEIDELCDQFEMELATGLRPQIDDYLAKIAPEHQSALRQELALLQGDRNYRVVSPDLLASGDDRQVDELVARYLAAQATGETIDRNEWLAANPQLANQLTEFWQNHDGVERAVASVRRHAGFQRSLISLEEETVAPAGATRPVATRTTGDLTPIPEGRYRLDQLYARGGMGEVWLADDAQIGRQVAIKRLRSARGGLADRFIGEAQITGQLEHPSIVPLHDLGRTPSGEPYYVMKFVRGRNFRTAIADYHSRKSGLDWPRDAPFRQLLEAFLAICRAVAYAHSKRVLHRDIKPDNIVLGNYGEAFLLDWGLAKVLSENEAAGAVGEPKAVQPAPR